MGKKITPLRIVFPITLLISLMSFLMGFQDNDLSIELETQIISICPGSSSGHINIKVTGGSGSYNYEWEGPDNFSSSTEDIQELQAGTYIITVHDRNNSSFTASDTFELQEEDSIGPNSIELEDVKGECSATVSIPKTTDNCAGEITGTTSDPLTYSEQGTYYVTWTFNDGNENSTTVVQTVIIDDTTAPVKPTLSTVTGECSAEIVTAPTTSDNCGGTITGTTDDPLHYNTQGTHEITWTFDDGNGNSSTAVQTVIIDDSTAPVEPSLATITGECFAEVSIPTTTDNCVGTITGTTTDPLIYNIQGTHEIIWTFNDGNGNITTAEQTVIVDDITAPVMPTIAPVTGECSAEVITAPATTDNCGTTITGTTEDPLIYNDQGTYEIIWTFNDGNGNITTAEQTVIVDDITAPITPSLPAISGECTAEVSAPTTTDNCAGTITGSTTDPLIYDQQGSYEITWIFEDGNGNTTSAVQLVIVDDVTDPVVPQIYDITWGCNYTLTPPIATDNCEGQIEGTTENLVISSPGQNIITWTFNDGNGNIVTKEQIVTIVPIQINPIIVPVSCHGLTNGSFNVNATGGIAPLQYSIDGGNYTSNDTFQNLAAGDYTISVRDKNGCVFVEEVQVGQPLELMSETSPSSNRTSCFGAKDGVIISGKVIGGSPFTDEDGTGYYKYSVNNIEFFNYNINELAHFEGLEAGDYTIFVKDKNGCSLQQSIIVEEPAVLKAVLQKKDVSCFGANNGELYLTNTSGGSGNYEFSVDGETWINANQSIKDLVPGSYSVQIRDTDSQLCILPLGSITISQPAKLEVEVITSPTTEFGTPTGSATANATGGVPGYIYKWQKYEAGTWNDLSQQSKTITNLSAGTYRLIVTDQNGCSTEEPKQFTIIDKITANISIFSSCHESENDIRVSEFNVLSGSVFGGTGTESTYHYMWDFGTNASTGQIKVKRSPTANPVDAVAPFIGDHDDIFIVPYNVIGSQTIKLTVFDPSKDPSTGTVISFDHLVNSCFTECGNANDIDVSVSDFFIGKKLNNGNYEEVVNCEENSDQLYLVAKFKTSKTTRLSVELEYTITPPGGTTEVHSVDIAYTVDLNKFTYFAIFEIGDGENDIHWNCGDDFEILFASFDWDKPGQGNSGQPHCLGVNVQVPVPTPLKASAVATDIACFGYETGSITVSVSGGSGSYTFEAVNSNGEEFSPTSNTTTFNNLPAGNYTVTVGDNKYPDITIDLEITQPEPLYAEIYSTDPQCYADPDLNNFTGRAEVKGVTGGTPPYTYEWNDANASNDSIVNLLPGNYTVTILDSNNCSLTLSTIIEQKEPITEPVTGSDVELQCGVSKVVLEANPPNTTIGEFGTWRVISGQPLMDYYFGNGADGNSISNDPNAIFQAQAGEYELVWEISNTNQSAECTKTSDPVKIIFNGKCTNLDFDGIDDHINFGNNFSLSSGHFTLEAWIKPEDLSGARSIFSKKDTRNPGTGGYDLIINSGALTFRWGSSSVSTSHVIGTDRWYHVAVVSQGSKIDLYVDGIIVGTSSSGSNPTVTTSPFLIGAIFNSSTPEVPSNFFSGFIEEVRLWNKALSPEELRFMMNQRVEKLGEEGIQGSVIQNSVFERNGKTSPIDNLNWSNLLGYYRLQAEPTLLSDGFTIDQSNNKIDGELKNIETLQENTAPLPYVLYTTGGNWFTKSTWELPASFNGRNINFRNVWDSPSNIGIDRVSQINWNIVKLNGQKVLNPGTSDNSNKITLMGLFDEGGIINMMGEPNQSGNGLTITHYLELNGTIDLNGESQLIQPTEASIAEGTGNIHRDQQGTASSFNYNYWSSPVTLSSTADDYFVKDILYDGSFPKDPNYPKAISFGLNPFFADNGRAPQGTPIKISETWLNAFYPEGDKENANQYSAWRNIRSNRIALWAGEGFTMKGSWYISVKDAEANGFFQNYTFKGFPNNGKITMRKTFANQNYLVGNPYPSAISVEEFIAENEGAMNGAVYFWDHFSGMSHYLQEYVGGYAVRNIIDGVPAVSTDERINANQERGVKRPGAYIAVGQGFFINTTIDAVNGSGEPGEPGNIIFKNEFREYVSEADAQDSQFHSVEKINKKEKATSTQRPLIRLNFTSPKGYWRQISVAADPKATNGVDYGFDARALDSPTEDMFWVINDQKYVIQGVRDFNIKQVLPLGIKISKEGKFTIEVATSQNHPVSTEIFLHDRLFDLYFNISEKKFSAELAPGEYKDRYEIVFEEPKLVDETEVIIPGELDILYVNGTRNIKIVNPGLKKITTVYLNNVLGQQVTSYHNIPTEHEIELPVNNFSSGIYIVKAHTEEGIITEKIILD